MSTYIYTLKEDHDFMVFDLIDVVYENEWLKIEGGMVTVKANYSWNGASPKFKLFGKVYGTPEGPIMENGKPQTYYATLLHDALYQFMNELKPIGVTRKDADNAFLEEMQNAGFKYAKLYYRAVRMFGWMFI